MKCKLVRVMRTHPRDEFPDGIMPIGTIVSDTPDVLLWVRMGIAEPADEECSAQQNQTPEQWQAAKHAYDRVSAGIIPEDYAAFDTGMITGYYPDGSPIPGPNAVAEEEFELESELELELLD